MPETRKGKKINKEIKEENVETKKAPLNRKRIK